MFHIIKLISDFSNLAIYITKGYTKNLGKT